MIRLLFKEGFKALKSAAGFIPLSGFRINRQFICLLIKPDYFAEQL
jgi:hypothetical protein